MSNPDPEFKGLLASLDAEAFEEGGTVYGVWSDFRLAYVNKCWSEFASTNNGPDPAWPMGSSILDAMSKPVRQFFLDHYQKALKENRPFEHVYECSSAKQYRTFHQKAYPLGKAEGLLIVNSLKVAEPMMRKECGPSDTLYRDKDGMIHQCSHCRRVQRQDLPAQWDWVPEYVAKVPVKCTHDLCKPCYAYYYNDENMMSGEFPVPIRSEDVESALTSAAPPSPSAPALPAPSGAMQAATDALTSPDRKRPREATEVKELSPKRVALDVDLPSLRLEPPQSTSPQSTTDG